MNIRALFILSITALSLLLTSCEKSFDELEKDPNRPANAPASLVFRSILNDMYNANNSPSGAGVTYEPWGGEQRYNQFYDSNYNYYATNEYSWTTTSLNFYTLKDVIKMEQEAKRANTTDADLYAALGKFFRAYFYENMTRRVGDVPLSEALQGQADLEPKYDDQKTVYIQILKWLEEANTDMATIIAKGENTMTGDYLLGNDLRKWQKVVNTYKLRVLISLSKKEADADLNIKQKFADVITNPTKYPVMVSMDDNLQFVYNSVTKYPRNQDNFGQNATRENMAKTYIDLLVARNDPRLFVVAEPAAVKLKAGLKPTDFASFVGASSGEDLQDMSTKALQGEYSFQNRKRYYTTYAGEPVFIIGYPELQFNIAEGLNRGWAVSTSATGNAADYYQKGISASMGFYGLKDGDNTVTFSRDGGIGNFDTYTIKFTLADYLAQPTVKYAGNTADGLKQILTQKYLAFFQNSGMEAWYNQRRTGVPTFLTGVGTGNSGRIPKRWQYPNNERTTNGPNLSTALMSQYGGTDDINLTMWLLK